MKIRTGLCSVLFVTTTFSFTVPLAAASPRTAAQVPAHSWAGTWRRAADQVEAGGPVIFPIRQHGDTISGTYPWHGCTTKLGAQFSGYFVGNDAVMAAEQTDHTLLTLSLTLSASGNSISGSWQVDFGTCAGASGPFDATRVLPTS
ncbi:MAG TPA: hypothetical protein VL984_14000 [Acidimicrobiales bacterium]|nr:hypothetical protein [Acidimicrobiales bacterium]